MRSRVSEAQPRCLSDLRFDALLGDELALVERGAVFSHLDACTSCRDRLSTIAYERSCFLASELAAPSWLTARAAARANNRTPWRAFGLIALAACGLLAALAAHRPKKAARTSDYVSVYAERAQQTRHASSAEPMRPGDVLRFAYTAERARELAILSVDASRRVKRYFPAGEQSQRIEAGAELLLPAAEGERSATLAEERVYALFCERSFAIAPLAAALVAHGALAELPSGCVADRLTLRKVASLD